MSNGKIGLWHTYVQHSMSFHYSVCRHVHEMSQQQGCTWTGWATTYMFPSPPASHDHTLGVLLLYWRVWPIQFLWVPHSIIQCIVDSVLKTYHPFLAQIPYTHAHTHTHLVPVWLPHNLHPSSSSSSSSCGWIRLFMYVCVCVCACMYVQASRVHDQSDQASWASQASSRDVHKSGGNTQSSHPKYVITYQHSLCKKRVTFAHIPPGERWRQHCLPGAWRLGGCEWACWIKFC